jgi:hypothetical protein
VAFADSSKEANPKPSEPAKPKAEAKPAAATPAADPAAIAEQLEELRQALQAQQQQIEALKAELAKRDHQINEAKDAAASANAKASEAATSSAKAESTAVALNTTVADLKASNDSLKAEVAEAGGQDKSEQGPASFKYKGITITPGGFIEAATVYRTRGASADINTPFTGIPFPNNALSRVSEFNATGRQSRLTFLFQGKADNATLTGYYEMDWLGACATSNNRQSNSYCQRQRQLWGQVAFPSGWALTGGQMWSLATETGSGMDNRTEMLPMTIDPQYSVGFTWARQYGFRATKNFNNKFWLGASVEDPQTTITTHNLPTGIFTNALGNGGGLFNATDGTGYSLNASPDIILKAAAQPGWGHYEVFGIISRFRARIYPCDLAAGSFAPGASCTSTAAGAFNDTRTGGGIGVNLRMPIVPNKKAEFGLHFLGGDGVGRYSSAQMPDVTTRPDGTLAPIRGGSFLGTLQFHPGKFDVYFNYGAEYAYRTAYTYTNLAGATVAVGYGSPFFNNSGCENPEGVPPTNGSINSPGTNGTCTGDLRNVQEATFGFWHQAYSGPKGGIRWGIQYSYLTKNTWSGNNNTPTTAGVNGKAVDNMLLTSFRYIIP